MSGNSYQSVSYFTGCQDGDISPMHSQTGESKPLQVLDISQPVSYEPYLPPDSRHYMRHIDPTFLRKDDERVERKTWEVDSGSMDREGKPVLCMPLTNPLKIEPEPYDRSDLDATWVNSLDINKLHYDPTLSGRNDPKLSLSTIPVSPYLQVAERFVNELSERKPDSFVDNGNHGAVELNMLPSTVVQGEQGGMAEEASSSPKPERDQRSILKEEESSLTHSPFAMNMYSSVSTSSALPESSVITNNILSRGTDLPVPSFHQDTSHDPSSNSSSNPGSNPSSNPSVSMDERYPCDSCEKVFPNKYKLSMHKRTHRKKPKQPKPNAAGTPIGETSRSEDGSAPVQDQKPPTETDDENAFVCGACGRGFRLKMALACHMRYHAEERSYTCADCGQNFTSRWVRSPQLCDKCRNGPSAKPIPKPCRCERCGKCFKDARLLRDHTRSHTGERPFACPTCGKTFAQSGTLYRHRQVHSDSRPYRCTQCSKSYKLKGHLTVHIKSHSM